MAIQMYSSLTSLLFSLIKYFIQSKPSPQDDSTHIEGMFFTSYKQSRQSLKDVPRGMSSWLLGNSESGQVDNQD